MSHLLEVDSIILEFGSKRVLQDVYIKCETGKITGLLGLNGSGKTCLLNVIFGEIAINDKSIRLDGRVLYESYRNPADFRYLPQFSFTPKSLTIKRIFKDFNLDFNSFIIDFPEFKKYYRSRFGKLSGGEQRLVEVYVILKSKTKVCMLDEPFSQIMPVHVESIKKIMSSERKHKGFIVTDHLYKHVTEICNDLYVISHGKTYLTHGVEELKRLGYLNWSS
jgi:ABC-type multidrug transport system ATPase subunit